jgi:hypothetical protein
MWWVIGGGVALALLVGGVAVWLLGPTIRTLLGPDFEPTPKDDASVERVQQTRMVDGGS